MKRNRLWMGLALLGIGGAIALLVAGGLSENMVYFLTPAELEARSAEVYDAPLRLGGQVKPGSVRWDAGTRELRFVVTDGEAEVPVESTGAPPAMFGEGIGVVVEGSYARSGLFRSTNVMVKHSNEYRPPEGDEHPREAYRSLLEDR